MGFTAPGVSRFAHTKVVVARDVSSAAKKESSWVLLLAAPQLTK